MGKIWAVPFEHDANAVTGGSKIGFNRIDTPLNFLSERTFGEQNEVATEAISNVISHIMRFKRELLERKDCERYFEKEWREAIAVIALSKYKSCFGYKVEIKKITDNNLDERVKYVFYNTLTDTIGNDIYVILINEICVGVFYRNSIVIPAREFPVICHDIYEDMSCNEVEKEFVYNYLSYMESIYREADETAYILKYINRFKDILGKPQTNTKWEKECICNSQDKTNINGKALNIADFFEICKTSLSTELFNDKLFIYEKEKVEDPKKLTDMKYDANNYKVSVKIEDKEFGMYVPFCEAAVSEFLNAKKYSDFKYECEFVENKIRIIVEFNISIGYRTERVKFIKRYSLDAVCWINTIPSFAVYPYIKMDESWNMYNIIYCVRDGGYSGEGENLKEGALKTIFINTKNRYFNNGRPKIYVKAVEGDIISPNYADSNEREIKIVGRWGNEKFRKGNIYSVKRFPWLVNIYIQGANGEEHCGAIDIDKANMKEIAGDGSTMNVAVDLGTGNTIAGYRVHGATSDAELALHKKELIYLNEKSHITWFLPRYIAPNCDIEGKISTVAQLYNNNVENVDNCLFYKAGAIYNNKIDDINNVFQDERFDMVSNGVYNKLKFGGGDTNKQLALEVFLKNLLFRITMMAKKEGASAVNLSVSYPHFQQEYKEQLENIFRIIVTDIKKYGLEVKNENSINVVTESFALKSYLEKLFENNPVKRPSGDYLICDIGDGTTDVSYNLKNGEYHQFAVRFAGQDIITDTIKECFRCETDTETNEFKSLWGNGNEDEKKVLIDAYKRIISRNDVNRDENIRIVILNLIESCGFNDSMSDSRRIGKFKKIVALKYACIFMLVSKYIDNISDKDSSVPIKIYLFGGGRFGIEKILKLNKESDKGEFIGDKLKYYNECNYNVIYDRSPNKIELVTGMLNILNDNSVVNGNWVARTFDDGSYTIKEDVDSYKEMYKEFIESLKSKEKEFVYSDAAGKFIDVLDLITLDKNQNKNKFEGAFSAILEDVKNSKIPECLKETFFCIKMVCELLKVDL